MKPIVPLANKRVQADLGLNEEEVDEHFRNEYREKSQLKMDLDSERQRTKRMRTEILDLQRHNTQLEFKNRELVKTSMDSSEKAVGSNLFMPLFIAVAILSLSVNFVHLLM